MNKFKCNKCDKEFTTKSNLNRHNNNKKNPCDQKKEPKIFQCDICLTLLASNDKLKNHKNKKKKCKPAVERLTEENNQLRNQLNFTDTDEVKQLKDQIKFLTLQLQNNDLLPINNNGLIYLIQPEELIGTNRYKFGFSNKDTLNRTKSYGVNTKYIMTYSSDKAKELESHILKLLSEKYVKIKNEYFEIDDICNVKKCILNECLNFD